MERGNMSITTKNPNAEGDFKDHPCPGIDAIIESKSRDLGGFSVRRLLPSTQIKKVGPWVFFDHMGPVHFKKGEGLDVRPHPHINLATVTYLFEGEILHRDSLGSVQSILPGDINLMVAGKGIVHSERSPLSCREEAQRLHGLQLWLALPKAQQEIEPMFYHYPKTEIPNTIVDNVTIRVMMGQAYGIQSPVQCYTSTLYLEAHLKAGQTLNIPEDVEQRAVYVAEGCLEVSGVKLDAYSMTVFKANCPIQLKALEDTQIALIGGEPMEDRYIWWNFVSDSKERIEQAKQDWLTGKFPTIPNDDLEFIPLPK